MTLKMDIDISKDSNGQFDIAVASDGDLVTTEGFDTALKMSIFTLSNFDQSILFNELVTDFLSAGQPDPSFKSEQIND